MYFYNKFQWQCRHQAVKIVIKYLLKIIFILSSCLTPEVWFLRNLINHELTELQPVVILTHWNMAILNNMFLLQVNYNIVTQEWRVLMMFYSKLFSSHIITRKATMQCKLQVLNNNLLFMRLFTHRDQRIGVRMTLYSFIDAKVGNKLIRNITFSLKKNISRSTS